jgi:hypothetical protein
MQQDEKPSNRTYTDDDEQLVWTVAAHPEHADGRS